MGKKKTNKHLDSKNYLTFLTHMCFLYDKILTHKYRRTKCSGLKTKNNASILKKDRFLISCIIKINHLF